MDLPGAKNVSMIAQAWDEWLRCDASLEVEREKYLVFVDAVADLLSGILPTWPDKETVRRFAGEAWDAQKEKVDG